MLALLAGVAGFAIQAAFSFTVASTGGLLATFLGLLSRQGGPDADPAPPPSRIRLDLHILVGSVLAALALFAELIPGAAESGRWQGCLGILAALILILLAVLRSEKGAADPAANSVPRTRSRNFVPQLGIAAAACTVILFAVVRPLQADRACYAGDELQPLDSDQALAQYREAVRLAPANDCYWSKLAIAYGFQARACIEPAERRRLLFASLDGLDRAVALEPTAAYHHANRGRLLADLARKGDVPADSVFAAFDAALELDGSNAYFLVDASKAALMLGDLPRCRQYAARGLELFPNLAPLRAQLGYLALTGGQTAEGAQLLLDAYHGDWYGDRDEQMRLESILAATCLKLQRTRKPARSPRTCLARRPVRSACTSRLRGLWKALAEPLKRLSSIASSWHATRRMSLHGKEFADFKLCPVNLTSHSISDAFRG